MAEIYRAKTFDASGHAHLVAVKRVLAHLAEDDDFIQMLVDEAKIAGLLKHPNVARVYEFARAHGEYFIAMEHVDGKDLRAILERCRQDKKPMPPSHAAYVGAEMAAALQAAHSATDKSGADLQIVHRDVSPSNIICAYTGEVKLCDYGIAKATLSRVQTRTGVIKGKVKYMSPEQALGRKLDHRSDIFSLGSVLYEMLTRVPPFTATNEMDLLIKVRDAKYRRISDIVPNVPPEIEKITDKCLARSRANRFQSSDDVHRALRSFLNSTMPNYSRSHLGRYVRKQFGPEIERELRMLEEYVAPTRNSRVLVHMQMVLKSKTPRSRPMFAATMTTTMAAPPTWTAKKKSERRSTHRHSPLLPFHRTTVCTKRARRFSMGARHADVFAPCRKKSMKSSTTRQRSFSMAGAASDGR